MLRNVCVRAYVCTRVTSREATATARNKADKRLRSDKDERRNAAIAPIYSHLRSPICAEKCSVYLNGYRGSVGPLPDFRRTVYARMMPPLSWRGASEKLPKHVTSVQRTVTEDFTEDRELIPNAKRGRSTRSRSRSRHSCIIRVITRALLIGCNWLQSDCGQKSRGRVATTLSRLSLDKQWGKWEIKFKSRTRQWKRMNVIINGQNGTSTSTELILFECLELEQCLSTIIELIHYIVVAAFIYCTWDVGTH